MKKYLELSVMMITGLLVSCAGGACFGPQGPCRWEPMMHYGFGHGGMFMGIIFLIAIGLLIYFIVQTRKTKGQMPTQKESPLDILKMRYAKGEIVREEYERMKRDLEG
jgi:putative membrane protein